MKISLDSNCPLSRLFFVILFIYICVYLAAPGMHLWHLGSSLRRLSCPAACGIFVPQPGIESVAPALKGGFLATGPPVAKGKSLFFIL